MKNPISREEDRSGNYSGYLNVPLIELHCATVPSCNGIRLFESTSKKYIEAGMHYNVFVFFRCRNCQKTAKTYALEIFCKSNEEGFIYKFGEDPPFGPPTPARVITLIGAEKEYYLKGRRAENQGMGIGAFAYYRRVVENQKQRIFEEIIRVAQRIGGSPELLGDLDAAKNETQFTKAVDAIKHSIPQVLLMNGHNPLTLLHTALSEGLHAQTDEQCLVLAHAIRVVLADLADRLGNALKDHAELNDAVSRLMEPKIPKGN